MRILIDADGCPVVDIAIETARRHNIKCIIVCDTSHIFDKDGAETVTVSKGADSADFALVNMLQSGDVVITQDYGLAAMCLARSVRAVSQDGLIYTNDNILPLLNQRADAKKIRRAGGRPRPVPKRGKENDAAFLKALDTLLKN